MITAEDIASGVAHAVAPTYQPVKFVGGEVFPMSLVFIVVGFLTLYSPPTLWWKVGFICLGVVLVYLVQWVCRDVDDRYFSVPMGFKDREEYIGMASDLEFERDLSNGRGFF